MDGSGPPFAPEPQYEGNYPRPSSVLGSSHALQALSDGYFGLNWVFVVNVVLAIAFNAAMGLQESPEAQVAVLALGVVILGTVVGYLTFPKNKRIAEGMGWQPSSAVLASVLMGLNSALCCGVLGYVVMQQIAAKEMKRLGLKPGFLGFRKRDVQRLIEHFREWEARVPPAPPAQ